MNETYKLLYGKIPATVRKMLILSQGTLVGSSPEKILAGETAKDFDIITSDFAAFQNVCLIYKDDIKFNNFGGIKIHFSDCDPIDMWVENLEAYIKKGHCGIMFNLSAAAIITVV